MKKLFTILFYLTLQGTLIWAQKPTTLPNDTLQPAGIIRDTCDSALTQQRNDSDSLIIANSTKHKPRVAIVLSGGGAKGMAHIGVLKVIERAGIPISIITGTSMGSLVGGLYSVGWNAQQLDSLVRKQDWGFLLSDKEDYYSEDLFGRKRQDTYFLSKTLTAGKKKLSETGGLIMGKNLQKLFAHLTAGYNDSIDFNQLPIPFSCVATNIVDNTEYDFHSGVLAEAMRSSMSIPLVFTPIRKGDMVLVDGGLRNNYPADIARQMGADYIIGATVQGPPKTADDLTTGSNVLSQIIDVNCKNKYDDNLAITDIAIRVNTKGYNSASFTNAAIDTLIRRGEEEAMRHWDELMALKKKLGLSDDYQPQYFSASDEARQPMDYSNRNPYERPTHDVVQGNVGLRFDNEEMVALQLNALYKSSKVPVDLQTTVRLGKRIMVNVQGLWTPKKFTRFGMDYTYRHNDIDIYERGRNAYNITNNHHQIRIGLLGANFHNISFDVNARWDYYRFINMLSSQEVYLEYGAKMNDDHFFSYHALLHYNSQDDGVFPTRGSNFRLEFAYFTDNFAQYNNHTGFSELSGYWLTNIPIGSSVSLQPMVYGRMLFGSEIPYIRMNNIGGPWFGHYLEEQMPFAGMHNVELAANRLAAAQLQAQWHFTTNNYFYGAAGIMFDHNDLDRLFRTKPHYGFRTAWFYRTMLGPVGAAFNYNTLQKEVSLFINLGYEF
ncbi:MAG: patatin-like phospholipase family protein [Prevotella sp.]|jgi:NTE family protein